MPIPPICADMGGCEGDISLPLYSGSECQGLPSRVAQT